jgi:hypothetical protein
VTLTSGENTLFKVSIVVHPAMVDAADAESVTIPFCMLVSKDEPEQDVLNFKNGLKVIKHVETFATQIHGWMAARADLADPHVKKEYSRGYETVLSFLAQHL